MGFACGARLGQLRAAVPAKALRRGRFVVNLPPLLFIFLYQSYFNFCEDIYLELDFQEKRFQAYSTLVADIGLISSGNKVIGRRHGVASACRSK
jgi:hypothetical protein